MPDLATEELCATTVSCIRHLVSVLVLALTHGPAAAAAPPSRGNEEDRSLAETVRGAEKLPGLVTFYRAPGKLWVEVPPNLIGIPLGLAANLVDAVGIGFRGESRSTTRW